ncbi:unnamed protein product [Rotaria socialis]|uniref:Uncharacterized protein n=1 Tax=Rotaria socialis TaxID=392032 RepID=A0A820XCW4_9BILA|nr:unnamed protein product [Rotaria socialis]CAF4298483.1 unnamed protein product [Rotaria socialis]CAF4531179.1 unnamed protein product [Rotaria socialis]
MGASLKGAQAYNTPLILFGILCGGSGSKKSAPIRIVKEACEAVEALDGIPVNKSSINASLWDELAVFLGIFRSTRIDQAAYDRGLMCEFYSPTGIVRRQLVTRHNVMIKPRLNIIAAGHPKRKIECLSDKDKTNENEICLKFVNDHLYALQHQLKQYQQELNIKANNFQGYTLSIQEIIITYIEQNLNSSLSKKIEHQVELIHYDYHIQALKLEYFQHKPNEY